MIILLLMTIIICLTIIICMDADVVGWYRQMEEGLFRRRQERQKPKPIKWLNLYNIMGRSLAHRGCLTDEEMREKCMHCIFGYQKICMAQKIYWRASKNLTREVGPSYDYYHGMGWDDREDCYREMELDEDDNCQI